MSTAKVSVAIGEDELAWARHVARQEGKSLSAVLTESLAEKRRLAALRDVVAWMENGERPLSKGELEVASRALRAGRPQRGARGRGKPSAARRK